MQIFTKMTLNSINIALSSSSLGKNAKTFFSYQTRMKA